MRKEDNNQTPNGCYYGFFADYYIEIIWLQNKNYIIIVFHILVKQVQETITWKVQY